MNAEKRGYQRFVLLLGKCGQVLLILIESLPYGLVYQARKRLPGVRGL
jgi:hypothetical protein